ncbi:MAG: peptidoglycan-binding domain-containing protein, partial [Candidatus Paceibacterota bacterium]
NSVSGNYTTVQTTGNCVEKSSVSSEAESALATQDSGYDYPLGIITFSVDCKDVGETATVSVYCFCENTPVSGTIARKYSESTGEYTTIDSAVIEEVTIDGQRALKMTYDVTDGGALDEDGLENGTIVDPVGFARVAATSSGGSSSGSKPRKVVVQNTENNESPNTPINEDSCEKYSFMSPMKKGSKFGEVSKLQELLNKKGISVGIVDGLFGPLTDMAVKQFQSQNSLDSDGIVGPMTRGVLNKVCK